MAFSAPAPKPVPTAERLRHRVREEEAALRECRPACMRLRAAGSRLEILAVGNDRGSHGR